MQPLWNRQLRDFENRLIFYALGLRFVSKGLHLHSEGNHLDLVHYLAQSFYHEVQICRRIMENGH